MKKFLTALVAVCSLAGCNLDLGQFDAGAFSGLVDCKTACADDGQYCDRRIDDQGHSSLGCVDFPSSCQNDRTCACLEEAAAHDGEFVLAQCTETEAHVIGDYIDEAYERYLQDDDVQKFLD